MREKLSEFIRAYEIDSPIVMKDLYETFPEIKKGTVRQIMKRLYDDQIIDRAKPGVYFKPNPNRVMSQSFLSTNKIIEEKYLKKGNKTVGYRSGLNFSNQLGLTSQLASVDLIVSNNVSSNKRKVKINKGEIVISAPRTKVTEENYKLLQILDLLNDYENLSEVKFDRAVPKIIAYLKKLKLTKEKMERYVDTYPLAAQVKFYKSGVQNEIITE